MSEPGSSTTINSLENNKTSIKLVWLDSDTNTAKLVEKIKEDLQAVINFIICPANIDSCITDIQAIKEEKVFLITPGNNACKLLTSIKNPSQLDSIFIFPENSQEFKRLCEDYSKVVGIFDNADDLVKSIKENIRYVNKQLESVSFYNECQQGTRDLSKEPAGFLWFQLFNNVIQCLPQDEEAKKEMLKVCRQYYRNNDRMMKDIDKFDQTYHSDDCIYWYTKETFVYQMINRVLRTEDIEQLYLFRYYIADLSKQLTEKCKITMNEHKNQKFLYRGTLLNKTEVEKIKANVGQTIAANSYWSTSLNRSYAKTFAKKNPRYSDLMGVLFEIECHLPDQSNSAVFADISELSAFPREKEFLFDAGSVFQIKKIGKENDDAELQIVQIRTTREGQETARQYIEQIQEEMKYESSRIMLGILLKRIGKYDKSLKYFEQLLKEPRGEKVAHIYNRIGIALRLMNKCDSAMKNFDRAYDLTSKSNRSERIYLAFIRHNQGEIYRKNKNFKKALTHYQYAVTLIKQELGNKNRYIADYYSCIGRIHSYEGNHEDAKYYQQEALRIREACLPPKHVNHAFSHFEVAKIYSSENQYQKALEHHLIALKFREKYLLPNHLNTVLSLHFVGKAYYELGDPNAALDHYQRSLDMKRKCLPDSQSYIVPDILQDIAVIHSHYPEKVPNCLLPVLDMQINAESVHWNNLARLFDNIARKYKSKSRTEDLLKFYHKALEIWGKYFYNNQFYLARLLDNIGLTYKVMGKMNDSLEFYHKALEIREKTLSNMDFNVYHSSKRLASLYEETDDLVSALKFYHKALKIYEYHYPRDRHFIEIRNSIGRVERKLK